MAINSGVGPHLAWVVINGSQFPVSRGMVELSYTKKCSVFAASVPLDYPGAREALADPGDNKASIIVSTLGQQATLFNGEIDDVEIEYVGGEYHIHLSGRDESAPLHDQKTAEKWVNKQPGDIISDLAGRVGLGVNIASPIALKMQRQMKDDYTKLTDNISFAMVIHKICELMGAHWFVKDGTLNVIPSDGSQGGGYSISWAMNGNGEIVSDCLSLKIKHNVQAGKPINVTVKSWHTRDEKVYEGQTQLSGNGTAKSYVYHLPNLTQEHVDQHAAAKAQDHKRNQIEITAECVGDPSIDGSQGLTINGTDFAGTYTVDVLTHEFGYEGHTMTIVAKGPSGGGSDGGGAGGSAGSQTIGGLNVGDVAAAGGVP